MLEPFKGELMLHPAALDYNAAQCSNRCAYCFAQARNAERSGSVKTLVDRCFGRSRHDGLTDWLFNRGYAVNVSNRTDPLAAVNRQDTAVAFAALNAAPNGVFIQTKGSRDVAAARAALSELEKRNAAFYVSITARNPAVLSRVEPGAADYDGRLELIRYAVSRGWPVVAGFNPLFEAWTPLADVEAAVRDCLAAGVRAFVIQFLHISRFMREHLPQTSAARLSDVPDPCAIPDVYKRGVREIFSRAEASGARWMYTTGKPRPAHVFDDVRKALGLTMRGLQDFVDFAVESGRRFFTFGDFAGVLSRDNPALLDYGARTLNGYLYCLNRGAWKESNAAKGAYTFRDVYRCLWENPRFSYCPQTAMGGGLFKTVSGADGRPVRTRGGQLVLVRCSFSWKAWDEKTMTLAGLKGKGVNLDELDALL